MAERKIFMNQGPVDPNLKNNVFDNSFQSNLTCRPGIMYPVYVKEGIASGHYDIKPTFAFDVDPLLYPIQTPIRAHLSFYKVPMRILMKNFRNFYGQVGSDGQINGQNSYVMPYIKRANWCKEGSLADYMGIPTNRITQTRERLGVSSFQGSALTSYHISEQDADNLSTASHLRFFNTANGVDTISFILPKGNGLYTDGVDETGTFVAYFASRTEPDVSSINSVLALLNPSTLYAISDIERISANSANQASVVNPKWYDWVLDPLGTAYSYFSGNGTPFFSGLFNSSSNFGQTSISGIRGHKVAVGETSPIRCGDPVAKTYNGNDYYVTPIYFTFDTSFISSVNSASRYNDVMVIMEIPSAVWMLLYQRSALDFFGEEFSIVPKTEESTIIDARDLTIKQPSLSSWGLYQMYVNSLSYVSTDNAPSPFESVDNQDPIYPVNALPFRAYEFIYRYFFENRRVTPFIKNGIPVYDEYITNDGDGADSTTPVDFFHAPYEYDMFTTCVPTPFFGNAPLVGVTSNSSTSATFNMVDTDTQIPYSFDVETKEDGVITGISYSDGTAKTKAIDVLQQALEYGISIADFRNADALTIFQERHMRAGSKFQNIVYEFFGTNPPLGEEYPVYLGGVTRIINVDKIQNTAQSAGNPLGDFAGTARFSGEGEHIRCFCSEPSYIIGILYFTVTPTYSQAIPPHFLKSKLLDYFNPVFANMSPQAVPKKWLTPLQLSTGQYEDVFGYNRPYVDYVQDFDQVHGEFRSSRADFLMQRVFETPPSLNQRFLTIHSEDLTDVFANRSNTDKFYGIIRFDVKASLPLPRFAIPQII